MSTDKTKKSLSNHQLHSLIKSLDNLLIKVLTRLLHWRLDRSLMNEAKGHVDIWGKLGAFIEAKSGSVGNASGNNKKDAHDLEAHTEKNRNHNLDNYASENGHELSELGKYYQRRLMKDTHSVMGEKMQSNTMDHINQALHFAHNGDHKASRLHIELAESAMHTAGYFMSKEEYKDFEDKVESRLKNIIENERN